MNNSRLGCLTPAGLVAAGLTVLIVAAFSLFRGGVLFSPGALNAQPGNPLGGYTSHAEFGDQCRLCHAPFWDPAGMSGRCETCHTAIAGQRSDPAALHGAIYQQTLTAACQDCHPDHRGPSASLTELDGRLFPHQILGYSLTGHATRQDGLPFTCRDCHGADITAFDATVCQTCHEKMDLVFATAHLLSFGPGCLACHDGMDTYGDDFDHNRFLFQLTGKHVGAPCSACHLDARTIPDLQSAPIDCFSCHADDDSHEGRFGTLCGNCHSPAGWIPAFFDHNLSAFPLTGKHAWVACESCHANNTFGGTPTNCYSCHSGDDAHQGRYGTNCAACHSTSGWTPATFDHNLSNFPLTGAHMGLPCASCHVNNVFSGLATACAACHADPAFHAGLFAGMGCNTCHNTSAWTPASYSLSHPGGCDGPCINHENASCRDCHTSNLNTATCLKCHDSNNPDDDDD